MCDVKQMPIHIGSPAKFAKVGQQHYSDIIMGWTASKITSLAIAYSTVYTGADQRKHQSSASLAFVQGIRLWPGNSPHKWPVTLKMFLFDDAIMCWEKLLNCAMIFLAATKQLYEWYFLSVCPSVRLSVRLSVCLSVRLSVCPPVTPFWLCSHHRIIMKFSGVITLDQGKVHAKGQGQRSKVKVTEVTTQIFVSGL